MHIHKYTFIVIGFLVVAIIVPFAWGVQAFLSDAVSAFDTVALNILAGGIALVVVVSSIVFYLVRRWSGSLSASIALWDKGHQRITSIVSGMCIVSVLLMAIVTIFAIPGEHTRIGVALIDASYLTTVCWANITLACILFSVFQVHRKDIVA